MVSQRQKIARKLYREAHPDLFPKPESKSPKDPDKKKKKKSKFKRRKTENEASKPNRKGFKKHPLRVPGMKPGETCFICKAKDHVAKLCPQKAEWEKHKICLLCRRRGHSLKNCPDKNGEIKDKKICYNCGETGHSLDKCSLPLQDGGSTYASCFICNEKGHLSKDCPQNTRGIYPKGGCCKICGGVTHLAKDCPNKGTKFSANLINRIASEREEIPRARVTKFTSGDDLEDDFMEDEKTSQKSLDEASNPDGGNVKPKKKKGTKVVNFCG